MHDCTVGLDRPLDYLIIVLEVDNDNIWAGTLLGLLTNAYVVVGL